MPTGHYSVRSVGSLPNDLQLFGGAAHRVFWGPSRATERNLLCGLDLLAKRSQSAAFGPVVAMHRPGFDGRRQVTIQYKEQHK